MSKARCTRGCKTAFVRRLFAVCKRESDRKKNVISLHRPYDRVACVMNMTTSAVRKAVHRDTAPRPVTVASPEMAQGFDNFTVGAIRRFVHGKFASKQVFTVDTLTTDLKVAGIIPWMTSNTSLCRLMRDMGFGLKTYQREVHVTNESLDVVCRRIGLLRALQRHREEGWEVIYIDETSFTTWMSHSRASADTKQTATSATHSRQVLPGEERIVVVAAGTTRGFVEGSFLCYPEKNPSGEYQGEMTGELFIRWLTKQLLPSLTEPSVLVLDNAPCHNQLTDDCRCPTSATKKADLISWLEHRNLPAPPGATIPELLLICQQNRPKPQYIVDDIIRQWGHEVIRLPPAHPELSAIEQVWVVMRHYVRLSLHRFTTVDLQARVEEARLCATQSVWEGAVKLSRKFEDWYWVADNSEEPVGPLINDLDDDVEDAEDLYLSDDDE